MRLVVQRVQHASVTVGDRTVGTIGRGLLVLAGTTHGDTDADVGVLAEKVSGLRVFVDEDAKMNRSVADVGGAVLVVSQFTLYGSVRRGKRPSFTAAGDPTEAAVLVSLFVDELRARGLPVEQGEFGAKMAVTLLNDGPVTLILESQGGQIV